MGAAASLEPHAVDVDPGGVATCKVTVRNTGSVVDEMTFTVLGPSAAWADVDPPNLSLFPGAEGTATVRFRPPRDASTQSGRMPFGLRVASREDPPGSIVEEGAVTVSAYGAMTAELAPRTGRGRRGARFEVAVDNRGNADRTVSFTPTDPAKALRFRLVPSHLVVPPGTAAFVRLDVRSHSTFLRGPSKTLPFAISVEPEGDAPVALDGSFLQEAMLPKWLLPAVLALVALALVWFFLLKPQIKDDARSAVAQPIAKATKQAAQAQQAAKQAAAKADTAAAAAAGKKPTTTTTTPPPKKKKKPATTTSASTTANVLGAPVEGRLAVQCPPTCSATIKAAPKQTISVTDLVLQNPEGDAGTLTVTVNSGVAFVFGLGNFRDLDEHFIAPITLRPGDNLAITVACKNPGKKACTAGTFYSAFSKRSKG
jgi:hypothetical protein